MTQPVTMASEDPELARPLSSANRCRPEGSGDVRAGVTPAGGRRVFTRFSSQLARHGRARVVAAARLEPHVCPRVSLSSSPLALSRALDLWARRSLRVRVNGPQPRSSRNAPRVGLGHAYGRGPSTPSLPRRLFSFCLFSPRPRPRMNNPKKTFHPVLWVITNFIAMGIPFAMVIWVTGTLFKDLGHCDTRDHRRDRQHRHRLVAQAVLGGVPGHVQDEEVLRPVDGVRDRRRCSC